MAHDPSGNPTSQSNGPALHFATCALRPGVARCVSAFVPGDGRPLVRVEAALGRDRITLSWLTDEKMAGMHFTAGQARAVAAELIASAEEIEGLASLEAEIGLCIPSLQQELDAISKPSCGPQGEPC